VCSSDLDRAVDGDTVVVPAGTCAWTVGVAIRGKGLHLTAATRGAVTLSHAAGSAVLIAISEASTRGTEVSGLRFVQGPGTGDVSHGMYLNIGATAGGRAVLVHDNVFESTDRGRHIRIASNRGVIWNNEFTSHRTDGNAIVVVPDDATTSWSTPPTMGTADRTGESNVYIEDNLFREMPLQALDPDSNSRVVIRHNRFDNSGLASHGADTSESGTRHWEIYDNVFTFTNHGDCDGSRTLNIVRFMYLRGGTGVIADNVIPDMISCAWGDKPEIDFTVQNPNRNAGPYACWRTYPVPHQIGQGHSGTTSVTDPVYIWGNSGGGNYDAPGLSTYESTECGPVVPVTNYLRAGRDFVVRTPRPGYTKFAYPHPLRGGR
jgi:hypothetical protein